MIRRILPRLILAFIMALGLSWPVQAQEILGTSVIGGKRIEILSGGTWRFKKNAPGPCLPLSTKLSFCGSFLDWKPVGPGSTEIIAQYRHDDKTYGMFIIEDLGAADGMTAEYMRNSVLENAASGSGVQIRDVPVLDIYESELGEYTGETMIYGTTLDGLPMVMANTTIVTNDTTLQVVTYEISKDYTPKHAKLHRSFLRDTRLVTPSASQ